MVNEILGWWGSRLHLHLIFFASLIIFVGSHFSMNTFLTQKKKTKRNECLGNQFHAHNTPFSDYRQDYSSCMKNGEKMAKLYVIVL